ncbi:MAG: glycosyltransferase [Pirellulales bacterium]|nr:glycosyltransferase [Pirellulales bacterium]
MFPKRRHLEPIDDRGPLRVMFVITCMPVGGAETLLVELIRRMDRERFLPELCCLKYRGPLGDVLAAEVPTWSDLLLHKYDVAVLGRLRRLMQRRRIDAVVTVGTGGDKMFWGRLAAWTAGVPVICSALHSTGLPDHVELPNRLLAPITDAFIGVANAHGRYLAENEGCPIRKVRVIPNGVDLGQFHPRWPSKELRTELDLPEGTPTVGLVAALRPEKRHDRFLQAASLIRQAVPETRFLLVGDGPERKKLETLTRELKLNESIQFLGTRRDVPELLALMDVFLLTSQMEANPVSILEAMAVERPVVAPAVGSIPETVADRVTGRLVPPGDVEEMAAATVELLKNPEQAQAMGRAAREVVIQSWSVDHMVRGYEDLLRALYQTKAARHRPKRPPTPASRRPIRS